LFRLFRYIVILLLLLHKQPFVEPKLMQKFHNVNNHVGLCISASVTQENLKSILGSETATLHVYRDLYNAKMIYKTGHNIYMFRLATNKDKYLKVFFVSGLCGCD